MCACGKCQWAWPSATSKSGGDECAAKLLIAADPHAQGVHYLWSGRGPGHDLLIHPGGPLTVVLHKKPQAETADETTQLPADEDSGGGGGVLGLAHHQQDHLVLGHRLQVGNGERLWEGGAAGQRLRRLHRSGEAVQPRPLAGAPHGRAGLGRAVAQAGRHGGPTQQLVQVETHGQGGQALHVGAVDQLLTANHVRLQEENAARGAKKKKGHKPPLEVVVLSFAQRLKDEKCQDKKKKTHRKIIKLINKKILHQHDCCFRKMSSSSCGKTNEKSIILHLP